MKERLHGMIAHMPMVYGPGGEIDEGALRSNIRRLIDDGLQAIYLMGSSGEFFNLSPEEYRQAVQLFVNEAGPDVFKVVGCSSARLGEIIETVEWLNSSGIDAVLAIPPYFVPLNARERTGCLREIAAACPDLGVVHYNTDYASAVKFEPKDYYSLLDVPNFLGTKHGVLTDELWAQLQQTAPRLRHLTLDDWLVRAMKTGGHGSFALITSFSPRFAVRWFAACETSDWDTAQAMDSEFQSMIEEVYMPLSRRGYSDVAVDKALVDCFGVLRAGPPRAPLMPVSAKDQEWAEKKIAETKYFQHTR